MRVYLSAITMIDVKTRFKAYYFVQFGALGVWSPYLPIFLHEKNFTGIQIGALLGTMPVIMIVFQPVWSYLSDILRTRRKLLLISSLGAGIAAVGLGLADAFGFTFLWAVLFSAFWAPLNPISTAILFESLEESGELDKFSLVRLWGSIGFAITSFLVGTLFLEQILDHLAWLVGGVYFLLVIVVLLLPERRGYSPYPEGKRGQLLAGNPRLVIYLLGSIFIGATLGVYNNYQTLFLQFLSAPGWLVGFTVSLQAIVEVPLMLLVPYSLTRLSPRSIILAGAILLPLRWLLYFLVQRPGWIAPSQLIHGVAVVSFFVVGVSYIDQLISPGWRATGQGLYGAAFYGIGSATGVYLAGVAFDWFGIRSVWGLNIILGLIGLGLLLFAFKGKFQGKEQSERLNSTSDHVR
jgi:MFS transporter, PPP family, 3-phenylpropionic acid transporter